ncbi:uncharacterized protein MONOS_17455 [Monocercomonoides exilis]|uniref:uncharacterized protein n=1 Tax=Monocercomonoides exilis TaxID=2049356 RepID=UPI00355A7CA3|nr:hypothetical protein MONOS_17455 [Monocercomonoides exilis]
MGKESTDNTYALPQQIIVIFLTIYSLEEFIRLEIICRFPKGKDLYHLQFLFHLLIFVSFLLRTIGIFCFDALANSMLEQPIPGTLFTAMSSYTFITCFIIISLHYVLAIHFSIQLSRKKFLIVVFTIMFNYIVPLCLIIPMFFTKHKETNCLHIIEGAYAASLNIIVAFIFLIYGIRLIQQINKVQGLRGLPTFKKKVIAQASICLIGFLIRGALLVFRYATEKMDVDHSLYTFINMIVGQALLATAMLVMLSRYRCCCNKKNLSTSNRKGNSSASCESDNATKQLGVCSKGKFISNKAGANGQRENNVNDIGKRQKCNQLHAKMPFSNGATTAFMNDSSKIGYGTIQDSSTSLPVHFSNSHFPDEELSAFRRSDSCSFGAETFDYEHFTSPYASSV